MLVKFRIALVGFVFFTFHHASAQYDGDNYIFPKTEGQYKYIAAVTSKAGVCSGTIISEDWILTAAHCLYSRGKMIGEKDAKILAGVINYDVPRTARSYETMSSRIVMHPKFWYNRIAKYDVALVQLRDRIDFAENDYVGSIAIAGDEWPQSENGTEDCMAIGFGGYRSTAPPTQDLKVWNVTAGHGEDACPCARRFQYKRLICVKELYYPHICKGDDGGPLVCGNVVRGVAHMIWDSRKCDDPIYPLEKCTGGPVQGLSTYTYLCPLNDWISNYVDKVPPTPPSCNSPCLSCHTFLLCLLVSISVICFPGFYRIYEM